MLRSMYSGISGMKANQTKMDVVGNNVANASTTAFKKSSVRFSDALNQTILYSSQPGETIGGVNPGQVGIGVKVSSITKNMLQGSLQQTGIPSDIAIDGDGFFVVQLDKDEANGNISEGFTRDGSFSLDAKGRLVTADGYFLLATDNEPVYIPDTAKNQDGESLRVISYNISKSGEISYVLEDGSKVNSYEDENGVERQQTLKVATFMNQNGLEAVGRNAYVDSANSGEPRYNSEGSKIGLITQGALEMSNVDLSEEFTDMIVTTRAFQASSKVITTSDELLQEIINLKR
ncbi:flagellar hook-basal body complex protein [Clostridioides difficile]